MAKDIEFYFDFSSPYGYIASQKIDEIAARHGRGVHWRPFLIGVLYKQLDYAPLEMPGRKAYFRRDVERHARFEGVPLKFPASFPEGLIAASRAVYWLEDKKGRAAAGAFARSAYRAYWFEGRKLSDPETVAELAAASAGVGKDETLAALGDAAIKERLKAETDGAIRDGVFGSPYIVVDGEPFWGSDRLHQVDKWLATGGW